MNKTYCELTEEELDSLTLREIVNYTGWIEFDSTFKTWDVTIRNRGMFSCKTQETAYILANSEMIIEMMLRKK